MAKIICVFFTSLFLVAGMRSEAQDTITFPLHLRAGFDLAGPAMKLLNRDIFTSGAMASLDLNESTSAVGGIAYTSFSTIAENMYDYKSRGLSFELGVDYNFLKPRQSAGRYYAGIGMRYGLSFYRQEATNITYSNPLGTGITSLLPEHNTGHYLVLTPGVRTDLFPGITIGWNIYMKILLGSGAGRDLKPVHMPGFGNASTNVAAGAGYFVSISVPYKKIRVFIKPKVAPSEEEGEGDEGTESTETNTASGSRGRL